MAVSLYNLSVESYLQTFGGLNACLEKGLAHCKEKDVDPEEIVATCLHPTMKTFNFQLQAMTHHSIGALNAVKHGSYYPVQDVPSLGYGELQNMVVEAQQALRGLAPADIDGSEDEEVVFRFEEIAFPFTVENFLLSFSLPNFYFHAATAYDILRMKGVPIGKIDYLGQMRIKS